MALNIITNFLWSSAMTGEWKDSLYMSKDPTTISLMDIILLMVKKCIKKSASTILSNTYGYLEFK